MQVSSKTLDFTPAKKYLNNQETYHCYAQTREVNSYVNKILDVLFERTKSAPNRQLHVAKEGIKELPVSFQLKLPAIDDASKEDLIVFLHYKPPGEKKPAVISIGDGRFKKGRLSGYFSLRDYKVYCSATLTPQGKNLREYKIALSTVKHEAGIAPVLNGTVFTTPILSSVSYRGKNMREKMNIVMPFADCDLSKVIDRPLEKQQRMKWTLQLLLGLISIEKKEFRLNDIKPENILVFENNVFFTDYGLASKIDHCPEEKVHGSQILFSHEKHQYQYHLSFKSIFGKPSHIDLSKSDIFSLGMTLFRMKHQKIVVKKDCDKAYPSFSNTIFEDFDNGRYTNILAYKRIVEWNESYTPVDSEDEVIVKMMNSEVDRISLKVAFIQLFTIYKSQYKDIELPSFFKELEKIAKQLNI